MSSLSVTLDGGDVSAISMRPFPTSLLPVPFVGGAFAARGAAVSPPHRRVLLLVGRPACETAQIVEQGKDFLRRRLDARRTLDAERVGPARCIGENGGDRNDE